MQDASGLLKEALDLLRQYNAAPVLQLEVQTAYEVWVRCADCAESVSAVLRSTIAGVLHRLCRIASPRAPPDIPHEHPVLWGL